MRDWKISIRNKEGKVRSLKPTGSVKGWMKKRHAKQVYKQAVNRYGKQNVEAQVSYVREGAQRKPQEVTDAELILKWLTGDLDCDHILLIKIARIARDTKTPLHINSGKRTYAEQEALYKKYGAGRAARPGTSRHETGWAADVVSRAERWRNIGDVPGARTQMKRQGLCLPVAGEPWHVEIGKVWNA